MWTTVGSDADFVEEAFEIHGLGVETGEGDIALGHEDEVVGLGAEEGGFGVEGVGVDPDVFSGFADFLEVAGEFLDLGVGESGLIDFEDDAGDLLIAGGFLEGGDDVEVGEGAVGIEAKIEEAGGALSALGKEAFEVVNGDGLGLERGLREGQRSEAEEGEDEFVCSFHGMCFGLWTYSISRVSPLVDDGLQKKCDLFVPS